MIRFSGTWVLAGLWFVLPLAAAESAPDRTAPPSTEVAPGKEPKAEPKADAQPVARAPFYLLVDHLSPALYEGEHLTACLRVENTTAQDAEVVLCGDVLGPDGKVRKEDHRTLRVPAGGQTACRFDMGLEGVGAVRFALRASQGEVAGPQVRILRTGEPWAEAETVDGRLTEVGSGHVLLPVVARCERQEERSFAPLSWLVAEKNKDAKPIRTAFIFLPGAWVGAGQEDVARELVPEGPFNAKAWARLGPYPLSGVAPILRVIGDCARGLPKPVPDRVILLLPAGDLDAATDPRLFQIILEVLLARLGAAGVKEAVVASPVLYGVSRERVELLEGAAREAVKGRAARLFDVRGLLDDSLWRLDAKTPGVYGQRPNEAGRKMIRQALTDLIP